VSQFTEKGTTRYRVQKLGPYNFSDSSGTGNTGTAISDDSKAGSKNRLWRRQVRTVVNAATFYTRTLVRDGLTWGSTSVTYKSRDPFWPGPARWDNVLDTTFGAMGNNPRVLPPSLPAADSSLDVQARISFVSRVRSSRTKFQSGVFMGELAETIHMIARPASALRSAISSYSRAAKKAARRAHGSHAVSKAITGTWLEHSYGWKPLFSDIDSAMEALANKSHLVPEVVSSFASSDYGGSEFVTERNGYSLFDRLFAVKFRRFVRYKGAVAWESPNLAPSWTSNWGLTLSEFLPTVWELIPYSFLVDYFSNLGKIIETSSLGTVSLRWGFVTSVLSGDKILVHDSLRNPDNTLNNKDWRAGSLNVSYPQLSRYTMTRTPIGGVSVGISDIQFRCPGVGSTKWLNIAALAVEKSL
jgi:hypothetical protein